MASAIERRISIFTRLFVLALVAALVPIGGLGLAVLESGGQALRLAARRLHLAIAADVRRAVRAEVAGARRERDAIGQLLLAPGLGDDARRTDLAGAWITSSRTLHFVTVYGPDGRRAGTLKAREALDPQAPEILPAELRAHAEAAPLAAGTVTHGARGPALELVVAVSFEGQTRAYLRSAVDLDPLTNVVRELGEQRLGAAAGVLVVDDARGVVVSSEARTAPGTSLAGRDVFAVIEGDVSFRNPLGLAPELESDEGPMLAALETIPELGWAIVVRQPRAQAYAGLAAVRRSILVGVGGAALAAAVLSAWLARRLTRPIAALVAATRDVAARTFTAVPGDATRRGDELGDLARAFDGMAHELSASEARLLEEARRRDALARYLSPDVVELVARDPARLRLGGERREVTVMFADVCAFTRIAEKLEPEAVVALLSELFTVASEIVHRRGGMVDKFIGDAVMAVWGAPTGGPDDATRALDAAEDLRRWVETANRRWQPRYGVEIALGIGVATGPAVAGNLGSERRMEYTVIGEAVNVAARLETLAQPGQILVAASTRAALADGDARLRPAGERTIAARVLPVFEVPE